MSEPSQPPPTRPSRGDYSDSWKWQDAVAQWEDARLAAAQARDEQSVERGQAVYERLQEAEAAATRLLAGSDPESTEVPPPAIVCITREQWLGFRAWVRRWGLVPFDLQSSMEFTWFGGSVLVVVR